MARRSCDTGPCVVGNMGSDLRFDYSVLGDSVNLCARLEDQTKTYGVPIIMGPTTAKLIWDRFAILEIDKIRVAGKREPTRVYTLVGDARLRETAEFQRIETNLRALLDAFQAGRFDEAATALAACRSDPDAYSLGSVYGLYDSRIESLRQLRLDAGWDGTTDMVKH